MPGETPRSLALLLALSSAVSGCGGPDDTVVEIHGWGNIDAFGATGETSFSARYSSSLDDESCDLREEAAGCSLFRCETGDANPLEDAGDVTVGGDALDVAEDGSYSLVLGEELVAGERLEMRASGSSAVPAHSGEVVVPERALVVEPSVVDPLVVDVTQDFVVSWEPVESDRVALSLHFGEYEVSCTAPGLADSMTVRARLLTPLPAGVAGTFRIQSENFSETEKSGWRVWFGAHQVMAEGSAELAPAP